MNLYEQALKVIPGGVNSPVRALRSVGHEPLFVKRAEGSKLIDVHGQEYIDFCMSWGVMIAGHKNPLVTNALREALEDGTSYGCATEKEILLAERLVKHVPSIEQVRCVSSGTEATMSALRLARGFTKRDLIIKFEGCYHGHADFLLVNAGSGVSDTNCSSSAGVPDNMVKDVVSLPYNNIESFEKFMKEKGDSVAAVIVEPAAANMGLVLPIDGFLESLREKTLEHGSVLIFDEVITGFRLGLGGAQGHFNVIPDMTCLGKIIGGGLPVGAFGGRRDIMAHLAPLGQVYQAGTLSGNPLAMTAGLATMDILEQDGFYENLNEQSKNIIEIWNKWLVKQKIPFKMHSLKSMFSFFITDKDHLLNYNDVQSCQMEVFSQLFRDLFDNKNIYLSPSGFETNFVSTSHKKSELLNLLEK